VITTDNLFVSIVVFAVAFIIMLICIHVCMKVAAIIGEQLGVAKFFFAICRKFKNVLTNKGK